MAWQMASPVLMMTQLVREDLTIGDLKTDMPRTTK
jgi:hypothetical protein